MIKATQLLKCYMFFSWFIATLCIVKIGITDPYYVIASIGLICNVFIWLYIVLDGKVYEKYQISKHLIIIELTLFFIISGYFLYFTDIYGVPIMMFGQLIAIRLCNSILKRDEE